ncbi:MAG: hypothetical protein K8R85_11130 [Bacteroidetes bacterium]|nr:hypothetical protein [Bacteroidota bacterium]
MRPLTYWYDIIIVEKDTMSNLNRYQPNADTSQQLLADITSTSKVARWRLWVWCVAACAMAFDVILDLFKIELAAIAQNSRYGSLPWYVVIAKEYQEGYNLVWQNNQYEYITTDVASQIISLAASDETTTHVILKVAQLVSGVATPLSVIQTAAFEAYITKKKPAGINVHIISDLPDELRLYVTVNYNPLMLTSTGESLLTPGTFPVEDAIESYNQNLPFNGTLELMSVVDKIQLASGVDTAYVTNAEARYGSNPFVSFPEQYTANAGHLIIDSLNPLNTTITYVANV